MRILIHTDEYLPSSGPCANRMKVFAEVLTQKGHQIQVLASSTNRVFGSQLSMPYKIRYAPAFGVKKKTAFNRLMNNLSFAVSSFFVSLTMDKCDIVITTSPPPLISMAGWLIAKVKRAKLIYDIRDIWPDVALEMGSFAPNSLYAKVFAFIAWFMYKRADFLTTVSFGKVNSLKQKLKPYGMDEKVLLVSNGFDLNILNHSFNQDVVEQYRIKQHFTCVYIGNIGLAQGLDTMLDIARNTTIPNTQFLLFGDGAEKSRLEIKAREEKIDNLHFCGVLDQALVPSVLKAAKMSYIPLKSASMKDSVPTKLYEALGLGCPVLLLAQGDATRLLEQSGLGVWVSPDDVNGLVAAFEQIAVNYTEFKGKRKQAMQLIQGQYSRQAEVERFEVYLHRLLTVNRNNC